MDKGSVVRISVLLVALINQGLAAAGHSPLPFEGEEVKQGVSTVITTGAAIVAWYKHNFVGKKGKQQKEALEERGLK